MRTHRSRAAVAAAIAIATLAAPAAAAAPRKFKPTREVVRDQQTGSRRLPTIEEVDAIVLRLAAIASAPDSLVETTTPNGTVAARLPRGSNGIVLARLADDGRWETRCVFSLDEGAEFLGLIEVIE
jgi:hypothetical protein